MGVDLDEVERLARAATQGQWLATNDGDLCHANGFEIVRGAYGNEGYFTDPNDALFSAALRPEVAIALIAEFRALRRFTGLIFAAHRNDGYPGDVDGGEIQQWALECGLVEERQMFEPCSEHCTCAEICDWPTTCYFDTALGKAVRAAAKQEPT
jgi:hypothetical protein